MRFGQNEIPSEYTVYSKAKYVVLPVPYEGTVCYGKGAARAPGAILRASGFQEIFDDELEQKTYSRGIATLKPLKPARTPEAMANTVEKACSQELANNKFIAMLGGEHSLSLGLYKALRKRYPKLSVIQIDAHADLRETYHGSRFSHACVMRRICETCHSTAQIGIRSLCEEEAAFIRKNRKAVYMARNIVGKKNWIAGMLKKLNHDVFLTIDIDGFDPSVIPHTGTPEPGGLSWYEGLHLFREIFKAKNVVAFDLVELASDETSRASDYTAAKLVYRLMGYHSRFKQR